MDKIGVSGFRLFEVLWVILIGHLIAHLIGYLCFPLFFLCVGGL